MARPTLSLRRHLFWLLLFKLLALIAIKQTFFPSHEDRHLPAQLFQPVSPDLQTPPSSHDASPSNQSSPIQQSSPFKQPSIEESP